MKTRLLHKGDLPLAAWMIQQGKLVAFPTETVYGLGVNALDAHAVKKVFIAKGRPADNPLIVHITSIYQLKQLVKHIPHGAKKLMKHFWPGPLSIVFEKAAIVPAETTAGLSTVVIRMPDHLLARQLIEYSGLPIAAPSANRSGRPSPTTAQHVLDDLNGRIDAVLDGGSCKEGLESTVIDVRTTPFTVLRQGAVSLEALQKVAGKVQLATHTTVATSPGMKYKHYAPKATLILVEGKPATVDAKIKALAKQYSDVRILKRSQLSGKDLFSTLRSASKGVLIVPSIPEQGVGRTVMDRLRRAASKRVIV